ncbi:MAG: hypothetical protein ACI9JL_000481 [Paracoccaceae bacterium]|jgi:hypothetical protein
MVKTLEEIYRAADEILERHSDKFTAKTAKPTKTTYNNNHSADFRGFGSEIRSGREKDNGPASTNWSQEDWQAFFEERAGIAEHDGGLSRADAEAQALACCVVKWMNLNPVKSDPDRCAHCGQPNDTGTQVVPFGNGPVWLHSGCWREWQNGREDEAIGHLKTSGVHLRADGSDAAC